MASNTAERLLVANEVMTQLAKIDTLSPIQARSFVRCLQTSWQVDVIKWDKKESQQQLDDSRRLIHAAAIFIDIEGSQSPNARQCYRRAAEILEWLSRSSDADFLIAPIALFAAGTYQLAGLPAMASSLLDQLEINESGAQLYAKFLQADFDSVLRISTGFWTQHTDLTLPTATRDLLEQNLDDDISWYITVELVRCLGLISDSLRRGDQQRAAHAITKLKALDKVAVRTFSDDASMLISILTATAMQFSESSIYTKTHRLAELNPAHCHRLQHFSRGQYRRRRGILWTSQIHGLERLLNQSSFALTTPTGSGKSLIATLALVKELLLQDVEGGAPLALYLVPSRALAGEVETKLESELGQDFIITGLYGGTDWGIADYWLTGNRPTVLVATVEKAEALMRHLGTLLLSRLKLLILDEAHQVVPENNENTRTTFAEHSNRSIRLESFVSRLLTHSPEIVRIALSAVAGSASNPVARWIEGRAEAEAVGIQYRSTRQIIGVYDSSPTRQGRMRLDLVNGQPLHVEGRISQMYLNLRIPEMPTLPAAIRNSLFHFNELSVLWSALHLVSESRRILISIAQNPEKTMKWYKEALELPGWELAANIELPLSASQTRLLNAARAVCVDVCGVESYEVALLDRRIATNHGQMPQQLRRLMTGLIEKQICPITVATATLTEGVNLPFDIIFVTALKRRSFNPITQRPVINRLGTSEFNNLAGRAGRPGSSKGMEGITLVSIPQSPSTTARGQIGRQQTQLGVLKSDYLLLRSKLLANVAAEGVNSPLALLLTSISERAFSVLGIAGDQFLPWLESAIPEIISEDAGTAAQSAPAQLADCLDELDAILLSALEELNETRNLMLDVVETEVFLATLWQNTFSHVAAAQEAWLEQAFIKRGQSVIDNIYPDSEERKRLYRYGFSPCVGRRFEHVAPAIQIILESTSNYGIETTEERLATFVLLGECISDERGFGFKVRDTVTDQEILANWQMVLAWWMQSDGAIGPEPSHLRTWQRFISENIEFRLGVVIGAIVSKAYTPVAGNPMEVPSLESWREDTGLPWFAFWARELLRWGTLDPFVAFMLSQGLAKTRDAAAAQRPAFDTWLALKFGELGVTAEEMMDPQFFLEWQHSSPQQPTQALANTTMEAELTGTTGQRSLYHVIPLSRGTSISWIDASGYELAISNNITRPIDGQRFHNDYELKIDNGTVSVERTYYATS